jgi:hypothetical protein
MMGSGNKLSQFIPLSKSRDELLMKSSRPVFTYLKSRGFYAGVQVDGTVVIERSDENERFYGEKVGVADILAGKVRHPPYEIKMLMETVKAAEGGNDLDQGIVRELDKVQAPGDFELASPTTEAPLFGVPEPDDPDPFGVLALEKEGFEIREAGTLRRPTSTQFEFRPSPTSPLYEKFQEKFHRKSMDTLSSFTKTNRDSYMSSRTAVSSTSVDRATQTEMGTQTDDYNTPITSPTHSSFDHARIAEEDEFVNEPEDIDYTKIDLGPYNNFNHSSSNTAVSSPRLTQEIDHHDSGFDTEDDLDDEEEEPVIFEAASAQATLISPQAAKARGPSLVNIAKRPPPPPLPPRSSARSSRGTIDLTIGQSPVREEFEDVDLHGMDRKSEEGRSFVPERTVGLGLEHFENNGIRQGSILKCEIPVNQPTKSELEVAPQSEGPNTKHVLDAFSDEETFHSLPVSPMERIEAK